MHVPPDNRRGRGTDTPASNLQQLTPPPSETTTIGMIPGRGVVVVVDLDARRVERLTRPWPGWWGDAELHTWTWTWAERSRRAS